MTPSGYAVGIDLGGTVLKAVAIRPDGTVLGEWSEPTEDRGVPRENVARWTAKVREILERSRSDHGEAAACVGVAAPGLATPDERAIGWMPGKLAGIEGLDWTAALDATPPIPVANDAHAALLGEAWLGAAAGVRNALLLTLGTGIGGAVLLGGKLFRGTIGRAGHLGHVCLDPDGTPGLLGVPGSLEDFVGEQTVERRSGGRFRSTRDLVAASAAGDAEARRVWRRSVHVLACALSSFINAFDPEAVILGGGIAKAGAALFDPLAQELDALEWRPGGARVAVVPARLGSRAGAIGAARNALLHQEPSPGG